MIDCIINAIIIIIIDAIIISVDGLAVASSPTAGVSCIRRAGAVKTSVQDLLFIAVVWLYVFLLVYQLLGCFSCMV